ncbi:hypothetical protein Tco_0234860 [Tanacetum coccineum]
MDKILKRFEMENSKHGNILMQEILDLNKTQGASIPEEVKHMKNVPYDSAVGSIMYANPGEQHWTAVKTILKYLRNTKDMVLVYGGNPEAELRVDCYCDAGFETDRDDTKISDRIRLRFEWRRSRLEELQVKYNCNVCYRSLIHNCFGSCFGSCLD